MITMIKFLFNSFKCILFDRSIIREEDRHAFLEDLKNVPIMENSKRLDYLVRRATLVQVALFMYKAAVAVSMFFKCYY